MLSERAQLIGAKFRDAFHPLICHMIDVAAVVELLWHDHVSDHPRARLAAGLGLEESEAATWVPFLAGLHDLGKGCVAFQAYNPAAKDQFRDIWPVKGCTLADAQKAPRHGSVSANALQRLLPARLGVDEDTAFRLALITGGHHGIFPVGIDKAKGAAIGETPDVVTAWDGLRIELFDALHQLLGVHGTPNRQLPNSSAMVLAGLISVTDWIGSNRQFFCYENSAPDDIPAYVDRARNQARNALRALEWGVPPDDKRPRTFHELWGRDTEKQPYPLQQWAQDEFKPSGPGLVIFEAPMGEGKTEAALLVNEHYHAAGFPGLYVGMPTQATANQLHDRVRDDYLDIRWRHYLLETGKAHVPLALAHANAALRPNDRDEPGGDDFLPRDIEGDERAVEATVRAQEWFVGSKRSLLRPFGVGTIDQALTAVLEVLHVFIRLFGLAGKTIVLDEVHAYDTYMTGLIERLLQWLAAMGSPVILLSATLPKARRQRLVDAYAQGLAGNPNAKVTLPWAEYPRITAYTGGDEASVIHVEPAERSKRDLIIGKLTVTPADVASPDVEPEDAAVVRLLTEQLRDGGCAAVICNTVDRAQRVYRALRDSHEFREGDETDPGELLLFHARFKLQDRERIERRCLDLLGAPDKTNGRPHRFVVVATQVIEQSLDLDVDIMITDIAPIDLLLQRSGRLQRHDRGPRRHQPPTLHIRWPEEDEAGLPRFDDGSKAVYDEHILLRTWWELRDRPTIAIPGDLQLLVDTVYAEGEALADGVDGALATRWNETWEAMEKKKNDEKNEAEQARIQPPWSRGELTEFVRLPREEDDPDLHPKLQALTRLARPSVGVVILSSGDPRITQTTRPTRERAADLLQQAVTITRQGLVQELRRRDAQKNWEKSPWLFRHRLLVIGDEPNREIPGYTLSYDDKLGLVVRTVPRA